MVGEAPLQRVAPQKVSVLDRVVVVVNAVGHTE